MKALRLQRDTRSQRPELYTLARLRSGTNTDDAIAKARSWLRQELEIEQANTTGAVRALGGAASGTDLLFHEVCAELNIPSTVVLPIPREDYCQQSVMDGGPD
jgi:hypothetical protein